jgi:hypothetical protein
MATACVRIEATDGSTDGFTTATAVGDPEEGPCEGFEMGEDEDAGCFSWAAISCGLHTSAESCASAVEVASPDGTLTCRFEPAVTVTTGTPACEDQQPTTRCFAVLERITESDGPTCEGDLAWSSPLEEQPRTTIVVSLPCELEPVPDFEPCPSADATSACACLDGHRD